MITRCGLLLVVMASAFFVALNVAAAEESDLAIANLEKSVLRVLYVGPNPDADIVVPSYITGPDAERMIELKKERMSAFRELLDEYFETVRVVNAEDYLVKMSSEFDVTIFDARPPAIDTIDMGGWEKPLRLPDDFDRPAMMVGEVGPMTLGRFGLDLQIDHL